MIAGRREALRLSGISGTTQIAGKNSRLDNDTVGKAVLPQSLKNVCPTYERSARDIRNQHLIEYARRNGKGDGT